MEQQFLISNGVRSPIFVDGLNDSVEWTRNKRTAWRMAKADAERRLKAWKEQNLIPSTCTIVEA